MHVFIFQGFLETKPFSFFFNSFSVKVPKEKAKPVPEEKGTCLLNILIQNHKTQKHTCPFFFICYHNVLLPCFTEPEITKEKPKPAPKKGIFVRLMPFEC